MICERKTDETGKRRKRGYADVSIWLVSKRGLKEKRRVVNLGYGVGTVHMEGGRV
jgi:hypothetical protein